MAWTTPRTWVAGETVTAALMNTHVRDQLNIHHTHIDDNGELETALAGVGFSSGKGNTDAGETDLTGYGFTIPAAFLADGESLELVGTVKLAANGNTKTLKFYPDSTNSGTIYTGAHNNKLLIFRLLVMRRSSTTAAMVGNVLIYATANGSAVDANLITNAAISSLDFTVSQTAKFTGQGTATDDIKMQELFVRHARGHGSIV